MESTSMSLKDILKLFRVRLTLSMTIPFFLGCILADKTILKNPRQLLESIKAFSILFMITSAGCLLNDYRDLEIDKKNPRKAEKPLVKGKVSKEFVIKLATIILVFCFLCSLKNTKLFVLTTIGIAGAIFYFLFKEVYLFDFLLNSFLLVTLVGFGWILNTNKPYPSYLILPQILIASMIYLHGAIWDIESDSFSTVKLLGKNTSFLLCIFCEFLFLILVPNKLIVSKLTSILFNTMFFVAYYIQNWNLYMLNMILFGGIYILETLFWYI